MLPLMFYGTVAAEGIFSSTSPGSTAEELVFQLNQTTPKLILCNPDTRDVAIAAAKKVDFPVNKIILYKGEKELELYEAVSGAKVTISSQELQWRRISDPRELDYSVVCLLFSSGTTGLPKAMKLSHRNLVASSTLVLEPIKEFNAVNRPKDWGYVGLGHLPVAHIAGVQGYLVNSTYMGGTLYWMPRFDFIKFCEYAKKYKVTAGFSVPPIFLLISKSPLVTDQFDTWVDAVAGAAPMGEDLQTEVSKKLGRGTTKLRQTWGLSETTGSITAVPVDRTDLAPGTVGSLVASHSARIIDEEGKDVEPGQQGEILVRGPVVIKGYWNNHKADEDSFKNGWFYTGDIGVFRNGWLYIVDRKKVCTPQRINEPSPILTLPRNLSNTKALRSPQLNSKPFYSRTPRSSMPQLSVLLGKAQSSLGKPHSSRRKYALADIHSAYVVADPNQISAEEIKAFVAKQVAKYKQLTGGVVFIPAIPKSPAGKILRKDLRQLAKAEGQSSKL